GLIYAGKVGTGFTNQMLRELEQRLKPLARSESPFTGGPKKKKGVHFVKPELRAEVVFIERTNEGLLRHPSFQGLREPPERPLRLTNPDKVLYEEQGITKKRLAEYYETVAEWMLPHVALRPLMLLRCPEGRKKGCFHQKHLTPAMGEGFKAMEIEEKTAVR